MPYFSIIIPTLNEEQYLPRLLKNLNQQTMTDFEVFVVDGQSDDHTPACVTNFPNRYPLTLLSTSKRNVSHQRNIGAKKSDSKILVFFDADTQIPKNYLEKIQAAFEVKRPHFLTTYSKADSRKPADQLVSAFSNFGFEMGRVLKAPLCYGSMMAIKKAVFEDIGGFDEITSFGEDSQLFQTAIDWNYKYIVLPNPRYILSLRRYRAEGTLETIYQYIRLNISLSLKGYHGEHPKYDMGGKTYQKQTHQNFVRRFDRLFSKMQQASKEQVSSVKEFFNQLFPES